MASSHATSSSCTLELRPALPLTGGSTIHISGLDYPLPLGSKAQDEVALASLTDIPLGVHFFAWDPPRSTSADLHSALPPGLTNRTGFFVHLTHDQEVARRDLRMTQHAPLPVDHPSTLIASPRRSAHRADQQSTNLSFPLPPTARQKWRNASRWLEKRPEVLQRVLGPQSSASASDELSQPEQPICAGKVSLAERDLEDSLRAGRRRAADSEAVAAESDEGNGQKLHFTPIALRRSWVGAVGEERTRWSLDKSMALGQAVEALAGDPTALLAEFELSFVLFASLSSPAALSHWQCLVELLCRSRAALGAHSVHQISAQGLEGVLHASSAHAASSLNDAAADHDNSKSKKRDCRVPELHASFMRTLSAQLELLDAESLMGDQASGGQSLSDWLVQELHLLRAAITDALAVSASEASSTPRSSGVDDSEMLISAWRVLSRSVNDRMGVDLDERNDEEILLHEQKEFERGLELGGEDAPVVVDL